MKALPLWLTLVGVPTPDATVDAVAGEHDDGRVVEYLILDAGEPDAKALAGSLASRLPETTLLPFTGTAFERAGDSRYAYLRVEFVGDLARVIIVLSDGRAYERAITPPPGLEVRAVATTIANTIVAIEEEELPADRRDEPIPRPPADPPDDPPAPVSEDPKPAPVIVPPEPPAPPDDASTRPNLGIGLLAGPVFGLAPSEAQGLAAGGGELRAALRWPRGPVAAAGIRLTGRRGGDAGLLRTRILLGAGYALRRERFEVVLGAAGTVEPWAVLRDSLEVDDASQARRSPLLGGLAWVSAGYLFASQRGVRTRFGAFAEFGGSATPSGTAARVIRDDASATQVVFTLGGVEVSAGLDVTVWIPLPNIGGR